MMIFFFWEFFRRLWLLWPWLPWLLWPGPAEAARLLLARLPGSAVALQRSAELPLDSLSCTVLSRLRLFLARELL